MSIRDPRLNPDRRSPELDLPARPARPQANALKEGVAEEMAASPEDYESLKNREWQLYWAIKPQNYYHSWMVQQAAITMMRVERCGRVERRFRDQLAARAEFFWDDDRRIEAEVLGRELAKDPVTGVIKLRQTPQGCDWMMNRWAWLALAAEKEGKWTDAQRALAFDLLGEPADARQGEPGRDIDLDGRVLGEAPAPVELARREIAGLLSRRDQVAPLDATDRALAINDLAEGPVAGVKELRRYEAQLLKRFRWFVDQTKFVSTYLRPHPDVSPDDLADPSTVGEAFLAPAEGVAPPRAEDEPEEILRNSDPLHPILDERDDLDDLACKKGKNKAYALANRETKRRLRNRRRA